MPNWLRRILGIARAVRERPEPRFVRDPCPICGPARPLSRIQGEPFRTCSKGHVFRDGPIEGKLLNEGLKPTGEI